MSCQAYPNSVFQVMGNNIQNKMLVLFDNDTSETPSTATNFSGIGIQSGGAMRYQVPSATSTHRFFCGTTQSFFITNGSGASGSDVRWKSDIQNITNALDKINNLQGRTFYLNNSPQRSLGFVAQEVFPIVPEAVYVDDSDENQYHFLYYDKLVSLMNEGIKELDAKFTLLENRVAALENI